MEVLAAYAAAEGASAECVQAILSCITTTEALELLKEKGILSGVMERVMERIDFHLRHRAGGSLQVEAIVFSTEDGLLGKTKRAEALLKKIRAGAEWQEA